MARVALLCAGDGIEGLLHLRTIILGLTKWYCARRGWRSGPTNYWNEYAHMDAESAN